MTPMLDIRGMIQMTGNCWPLRCLGIHPSVLFGQRKRNRISTETAFICVLQCRLSCVDPENFKSREGGG